MTVVGVGVVRLMARFFFISFTRFFWLGQAGGGPKRQKLIIVIVHQSHPQKGCGLHCEYPIGLKDIRVS